LSPRTPRRSGSQSGSRAPYSDTPGTALGTAPGSLGNPHGTATEPPSGTAPVPVSKPLHPRTGTTTPSRARGISADARRILAAVVERIREVSPAGLGHWSPAWELVHVPGDRFLDSLRLWEEEDSPGTRDALQRAAEAFVAAWRTAAERWEAEGRPTRATEDALA